MHMEKWTIRAKLELQLAKTGIDCLQKLLAQA